MPRPCAAKILFLVLHIIFVCAFSPCMPSSLSVHNESISKNYHVFFRCDIFGFCIGILLACTSTVLSHWHQSKWCEMSASPFLIILIWRDRSLAPNCIRRRNFIAQRATFTSSTSATHVVFLFPVDRGCCHSPQTKTNKPNGKYKK